MLWATAVATCIPLFAGQQAPSHFWLLVVLSAGLTLFPADEARSAMVLVGLCALGFAFTLYVRHLSSWTPPLAIPPE